MELMSVVLYCLLLTHMMLETRASWTPCSPSDSSVQCDISDDENKCVEHEYDYEDIPVIEQPEVFPPQLVPIPGSQHNGVIFQWQSPSAQALNSTTGFLITIRRYGDNRPPTIELCVYANVSSSKSTVTTSDAKVVFSYEIGKLEGIDTEYTVVFVTLPKGSVQGFDIGSEPFRTDSSINPTTTTTAAPPVDYESIMDLSADDSVPYKVTGSFRRAAHYPNLIAQEQYNFTSYSVVLLDVNNSRVRAGIFDNENSPYTGLMSIESLGPEYITFTFEDLIPGFYQVHVWPLSFCDHRDLRCFTHHITTYEKVPVSVRGTDYRPSSPDLMVSQSNDVTVQFEVAPRSHYITSYYVKLYKPGVDSNITEVLPHPNASDFWYLYSYNISSDEVLAYFEPGESITAEVIPQQQSRLCIEKGQCNLNGTCTPCTPSISQQQTLIKEPATTATVSLRTADIGWVAMIVAAVALVLAIVAVVLCRRKQIGITDVIKFFTQKCQGKPERDRKITVCMAYVHLSEYREFNCHLRSVLENYFHCEVDVYTGDPSDMKYKSCDYVVVVFSPKLLQAYRFLEQKPGVIPEDQRRRKAVLDILLNPQHTPSPAVLFVAFDNIPLRQVNELVTRNSSLKVFRLPSDLRLLVTELHHESNGLSYNDSMKYFEESPLKEGIDKAMNEINDSGLGDVNDTMTVNTEAQHDDRFGCHAGDNYEYDGSRLHTTTPRAAEQQFLPNRLNSQNPTRLPSEPAAFPMLPNGGDTACAEMEVLNNNVQRPKHTVIDETKPPNRNISVDSGSDCRGISGDCESIPSSEPEDSFQFSDYRTSSFPDSMLPAVYKTSETVDTVEC